jgi:hypothetical protein
MTSASGSTGQMTERSQNRFGCFLIENAVPAASPTTECEMIDGKPYLPNMVILP